MNRRNARPLVALAAAYALALQAVLAGLVLGARTGEAALLAAGGLCLPGQSQGDPAPGDRMPCCTLSACSQAGTDAAPLPGGAPAFAPPNADAASIERAGSAPARAIIDGLHQPRAPPPA